MNRQSTQHMRAITLGLLLSWLLLAASPAYTNTYPTGIRAATAPLLQAGCTLPATVTTADQLYDCITAANAGSGGTITLGADIDLTTLTTSPLPNMHSTIVLEGAGYAIDGGGSMGIFNVEKDGDLTVNQTTLQNGNGTPGGAIYNLGTLFVTNSTFSNNLATGGGAIYNYYDNLSGFGTATITNSTFSGNNGGSAGGAINNTGGQVTVTNSTFSGNSASLGGAIYINRGQVTATSNTFAGNSASNLGDATYSIGVGWRLYLAGNIFVGSASGDNCRSQGSSAGSDPIDDNGYNLSDDATCTNGGAGSATNATLNLGNLADNGGLTLTHLPGYPGDAIFSIPNGTTISNNGTNWSCNDANTFTDQRGQPRPTDSGGFCTAGAVEVSSASICPSWTATTADGLSACISRANGDSSTVDTITLGVNIDLTNLTTTELPRIETQITLEGAGYTIDANNLMRHFFVTATGDFTINQTILQNGSAANGGSIHNRGKVTLSNSTLSDNSATGEGGGIYTAITSANSTVRNSTLTGNTAVTGGAISNRGATTVSNSTFSGNIASSSGGAVYNRGPFKVTSSTFSGNSAPTGEAIHLFNNTANFAGNLFAGGGGDNCAEGGTLVDNGYNLSDDATCTNGGSGSITNATLDLGSLAANGGSTLTHLPGAASDAIGTIPYGFVLNNGGDLLVCNSSSTDQIGNDRPLTIGLACSSGAVEASSASLIIIKDASPAIGTDFDFIISTEPLLSYSGSTVTAPFWTRPDAAGVICTISLNSVRHHVQPFAVDTNGTYTIDSVQSYNGYIYLYQDSFNALDQCNNYLNGNDGEFSPNQSALSHELEAGRVYFLVTSGFDDADAGTFTNTITRVGGGGNAYTLYDSFTLDDAVPDDGDDVAAGTTFYLSPGTYTVTEAVSSGWDLTNASCTGAGGTVSLTDETLSVEISDGEAVECTFVNELICPASWTVATADELYDCIALANANESPSPTADTITLGADITLTSALPQISSEITLEGAGYFIDGGNSVQIFNVASTGNFTINQATLQNGYTADVGGAIKNNGTLVVSTSTISGNTATDDGGGISNNGGTLTITDSTLSNNAATYGGGIRNYAGTVTLINSTFSGNSASGNGGGIENRAALTVVNSTFSGNLAPSGGGIDNYSELTVTNSTFSGNSGTGLYNSFGTVYLAGNIFASGASGNNCHNNDTLADNGYNLSDEGTCTDGGTGSVTNATLNLGALADNGGTTQTHLPGAGSNAIGAIPNGTTISNNGINWTCDQSTTDQRGESRPINSGDDCSAGAVEVGPPLLCPSWTVTTADELYDCITLANGNESPSPTADTIILGADITLTTLTNSPLPDITSAIVVEGAGYAIDGGSSVSIFAVSSSGDLTVNQATLQNGAADFGSAIDNRGTVTVTNSTFSGNVATVSGGAIYNDYAIMVLTSNTFFGNSAGAAGGIYNGSAGTMHLAGNIFAVGANGNNCMNDGGTLNDNGYNLSSDTTCANGGTGSATNATLNLGALSGGVHTPQAGSDAIGAIPYSTTISNNGTSWTCNDVDTFTDQRGESRPINSGEACTAGAVEVVRVQLTLHPNGFFSWLPDLSGSCSESLYRSSTPYVGHTWLTDDPANYDGSGSLTSVTINYFYYLLVDCGGSLSQSNEVGEFTFAIVPGG